MSNRILVVTQQGEARFLTSESTPTRVITIQPTGARGETGATGAGVPTGGFENDILKKTSATNYATAWETPTSAATSGAIVRRGDTGEAFFGDYVQSLEFRADGFRPIEAFQGAELQDDTGGAVLKWGTAAQNIIISVDTTSTGHFLSNPGTATAGHFLTKNGTAPTIVAGRSAWFSNSSGNPQFKNGTSSAVTLIYDGGALGTPSSGTLTSCTGLPVSTGISGLGTGVATFLATPNSLNLQTAVTDETGSGLIVFNESPTINDIDIVGTCNFNVDTYSYGTGSAALHRTALGLTTLATTTPGTNVAAFLETPTSANLAAALTDETGTGLAVFSDGPTLNSPVLNTPVFTATTIADIATLNIPNTRPPCVMFDDFLGTSGSGAFPWADSGTGTTDAGPSGGAGLFYGMVRLNTGATSTNSRTRTLPIGLTNIANGATWRACFAIPTITDVTVFIGSSGGGSNYGLYYNHGVNSSQWVLSTTGATITTFTSAVAEAGNFLSGKRYQMTLQRVSNTSCTLLLEITDWNSAVWTTVFNGTITHAAETPNWSAASPLITVATKTAAARTLMLDWFAMHHTGITR